MLLLLPEILDLIYAFASSLHVSLSMTILFFSSFFLFSFLLGQWGTADIEIKAPFV